MPDIDVSSYLMKNVDNPQFNQKTARGWYPLCYPQLRNKPPAFLPHVHKARLLTFLFKMLTDFQVFLQAELFCLVSGGEEIHLLCFYEVLERFWLKDAHYFGDRVASVMHSMSRTRNGTGFQVSFYASMFKRFIFPVKFSYAFKSTNTSWQDSRHTCKKLQIVSFAHSPFQIIFHMGTASLLLTHLLLQKISDICSFTSLAATLPSSFAFYFMVPICALQLCAL